MEFRCIDWNVGHVAEHGVTPAEVEYVVNRSTTEATSPKARLVTGTLYSKLIMSGGSAAHAASGRTNSIVSFASRASAMRRNVSTEWPR